MPDLTIDALLARTIPTLSGCLEWQGALTSLKPGLGYGAVRLPGTRRMIGAHRAMFQLANGVVLASTQFVCHSCDNRKCINPDHLWLGTHADNVRDMHAKGRDKGNRRLTLSDVQAIRARYRPGRRNAPGNRAALAQQFRVSLCTISEVVNHYTWR